MREEQLASLLTQYAREPSSELMEQLVEGYLPLCHAIAKRFLGRGVEADDLFQVASMALMKAITRFEPARGLKFSTFATPTIAGEVRNYLRDKGSQVRFSRDGRNQLYKLQNIRDTLTQELRREPTLMELSQVMEITPEELLALLDLRNASQIISMDAPVSEEDEQAIVSRLGSHEDGFEQVEQSEWLKWVFSQVTPAEKSLLELRYVKQMGQRETARQLGVSQMQVSRLERRLLSRLRQQEGVLH